MIIARTGHEKYDFNGIAIYDLPQWLMSEPD